MKASRELEPVLECFLARSLQKPITTTFMDPSNMDLLSSILDLLNNNWRGWELSMTLARRVP